jgi:hypothetical protein
MNKENMIYVHNGVLLSHKEEWNYAVCKKMDVLANIILSEINQVHNVKYHIYLLICGSVWSDKNNNNGTWVKDK